MIISRSISDTLLRYASWFPVVVISGPRQSGKTTLVRQLFSDRPYVSMEDADTRQRAEFDPKAFLQSFPNGAVIDEVQRTPGLLSDIQSLVDRRGIKGDFILTGSQQFGLLRQVSQSLAGRAGVLQLLPLSHRELKAVQFPYFSLEQAMWQGGYPVFYRDNVINGHARKIDGSEHYAWFNSYVMTYIERDIRDVLQVSDTGSFRRFLLMCAARVGQLLNMNALASECGISHTTAKRWLTALETSYIVHLLEPHHQNFGKRLVKTPKLYFYDTGLVSHLLRIESARALETHAYRGPIFENWVINETIKYRWNQGLRSELYFWRDNHGTKIDLVFESNSQLNPVELKSGMTFSPDWLRPWNKWQSYSRQSGVKPVIVYGGDQSHEMQQTHLMSWNQV
jgi:uncharacterized protein